MTRTKTRTTRAYVWLTPQEKSNWKIKAASAGMSLNDYVRCCVERRKMPAAIPEVNRQTAMEHLKIGVNLNQQVRAMNTALARLSDYPQCRGSALVGYGSFEVSQTAPRRAARSVSGKSTHVFQALKKVFDS